MCDKEFIHPTTGEMYRTMNDDNGKLIGCTDKGDFIACDACEIDTVCPKHKAAL